jgi:hypothetical protein
MDLENTFNTSVGTLVGPAQCILALSIAASLCFTVFVCLRWHQLQKSCIKIGLNNHANIKVVSY